MSAIPDFYAVVDALIREMAEEQGRDAEEVKAAILTNIEKQR
jgi:hypothetical protein